MVLLFPLVHSPIPILYSNAFCAVYVFLLIRIFLFCFDLFYQVDLGLKGKLTGL